MARRESQVWEIGKPSENIGWELSLAGATADCVVMTKLHNLSEVRLSCVLKQQKQVPILFYTERLNGKG